MDNIPHLLWKYLLWFLDEMDEMVWFYRSGAWRFVHHSLGCANRDEQMSNWVGVEHQPAIKIGDLGGWVPLFLEGHPCGGSKTQLFQTVFQTVFQKQISTILLIRPNWCIFHRGCIKDSQAGGPLIIFWIMFGVAFFLRWCDVYPILGCRRKLGSMVRINGLFHLLINGVYWGYHPITNLLLTSWDIQVCFMYGIFAYIYHQFKPNVGIYHMYGASGSANLGTIVDVSRRKTITLEIWGQPNTRCHNFFWLHPARSFANELDIDVYHVSGLQWHNDLFHAPPLHSGGIYTINQPLKIDTLWVSDGLGALRIHNTPTWWMNQCSASWFRPCICWSHIFSYTKKMLAMELAVLVLEAVKCLKKISRLWLD